MKLLKKILIIWIIVFLGLMVTADLGVEMGVSSALAQEQAGALHTTEHEAEHTGETVTPHHEEKASDSISHETAAGASTHQVSHEPGHETAPHAVEHGEAHSAHGEHEVHDEHHAPAATSEAHHPAASQHGTEHGDAHSAHGEHHAAHATPGTYYFSWCLLGLLFLISFAYFVWVRKIGKPKHESLALAGLLVFLIIILYYTEQLPSLHGYFSAAEGKFIPGYHEPNSQALIRFFYKVIVAVLLVIYSFLGIHEH